MRVKIISILLCWVLILTSPGVLAQQAATSNQSWDVLKQTLTAGKIRIETKSGKKMTGHLKSVSDTELMIEREGLLETFNRDEVKAVWTITPPSRLKKDVYGGLGLFGGLMAGIAIAVGLGQKDCGGGCSEEGTGIIAALVGLPMAGSLAGRALAEKGKRRLVYSVP